MQCCICDITTSDWGYCIAYSRTEALTYNSSSRHIRCKTHRRRKRQRNLKTAGDLPPEPIDEQMPPAATQEPPGQQTDQPGTCCEPDIPAQPHHAATAPVAATPVPTACESVMLDSSDADMSDVPITRCALPHGQLQQLSYTCRFLGSWMESSRTSYSNMDLLLKGLRHPEIRLSDVPRSGHCLLSTMQSGYPHPAQRMMQCKTKGHGGKKKNRVPEPATVDVDYFDLLNVLALMLRNDTLRASMVFEHQESDVIAHPCNTEGWRVFQQHRDRLSHAKGVLMQLLAIVVWLDGYEQHKKHQLIAVWMTLANLPMQVLESTSHKYLLALLPSCTDLCDALNTIIVQPLQKLERGQVLGEGGSNGIPVCGSLFALLGDHPGISEAMSLGGALREFPSHHSLASSAELNVTRLHQQAQMPPLRDSAATLQRLNDLDDPTTTQSERRKELAKLGLIGRSCLWDLLWVQQDIFDRLGCCYLHLCLLGNWEKHTTFIAAYFDLTDKINTMVRALPRYPTIKHIVQLLVWRRDSAVNRDVLVMATRTGRQVHSWIQRSLFVLLPLLKSFGDQGARHLECWRNHLQADNLLYRSAVTREECAQGQRLNDKWRFALTQLLPEVREIHIIYYRTKKILTHYIDQTEETPTKTPRKQRRDYEVTRYGET